MLATLDTSADGPITHVNSVCTHDKIAVLDGSVMKRDADIVNANSNHPAGRPQLDGRSCAFELGGRLLELGVQVDPINKHGFLLRMSGSICSLI